MLSQSAIDPESVDRVEAAEVPFRLDLQEVAEPISGLAALLRG